MNGRGSGPAEHTVTGSRRTAGLRSQFVTGSQKHRDPRYLPNAFTEHGAIMAANVLNTPRGGDGRVFCACICANARDTRRQSGARAETGRVGKRALRATRLPRTTQPSLNQLALVSRQKHLAMNPQRGVAVRQQPVMESLKREIRSVLSLVILAQL